MKPARILYLIDELDIGGTEQQLLELLRDLDRRRFEPMVACFRDKGRIASEIEGLGVPVTLLPKQRSADPLFLLRLIRFLSNTRPDVLQTFLFTANTWGRVAARICRVPVVIACERNVDTWKGPTHRWVDRFLARFTTCIVVNAACIRQFVREDEGVKHPDIRVIYNGVRMERFAALSGERRRGSALAGIIGRLEPQKDHATGLRAFAILRRRLPQARLRIVGGGSLEQELRQQVKTLNLDEAVEFAGATRDVSDALAGLDVLVLSSTREGCANVILEGMAAGVPVVATAVGGNAELVEDGVSGWIVPSEDPEALARAMEESLSDPESATSLAGRARERARVLFSVPAMVHAYEALYEELLHPPLRVCYVIDDLGIGGAQQQLRMLVENLDRRRFAPVIVSLSTRKNALLGPLEERGLEVICLSQQGALDLRTFRKLYRLFRERRFEIVQTCLFTADLYGRLAAWLARVPFRISSVRSTDPDKPGRQVWADRVLSLLTQRFIVNAACVRDVLEERERVRRDRIVLVRNGVITGSSERRPRAANRVVLGSVGRLEAEKGYDTLLRALHRASLEDARLELLLVGDGSRREPLESLARELGIETRVQFLGFRDDVRRWIEEMDAFVLPSRYEGCSNALLEAMACGCPVIATRVGGNAEVIEDGVSGLLVAPDQVEGLAAAILRLSRNPEEASGLAAAARARLSLDFSPERMLEATTAIYRDLHEEG